MELGKEFKSSGITENTPKNIMLGAGTIHKDLKFDSESNTWNFKESLLCATSGGSKVTITPELKDIEVDGALVKVKGLQQKVGETATMETNPVELTPKILKMSLIGDEIDSETAIGYSEIKSRARIEEDDYLENMAYVGKTLEGKPIIILFEYAICTSGLALEGKNKEASVPPFTFECVADLSPESDTLPWHIYYPKEGSN
ncbi:hypothetical protein P261_02277 [Lachnospiraceae bacterium TWA4]|nr:hypothetical protein P261_02277 [Lachnospiraceae bacterium TWA4]